MEIFTKLGCLYCSKSDFYGSFLEKDIFDPQIGRPRYEILEYFNDWMQTNNIKNVPKMDFFTICDPEDFDSLARSLLYPYGAETSSKNLKKQMDGL